MFNVKLSGAEELKTVEETAEVVKRPNIERSLQEDAVQLISLQ